VPDTLLHRGIRLIALPALVAAGWLLATQHHAVSGLDASWTERGHILRGALTVFGSHPLLGAGPDPWIPTKTLSGLPGVDAFAHNEPLELLISVGLLGTAVIVAAAVVVVRHLHLHRHTIVGPLAAGVAAAGLVDFVWHFAALGLLCGAVAATATRDRR
jgi:O-antigen ligase